MEEKIEERGEQSDLREMDLDLNFVPKWARKPPGKSHYSHEDYVEDDRTGRRDARRSPRRDRDDRRTPRREKRREERSTRPREDRAERPPREPLRELPVEISFLPEQQRLASLVRQIHHSRRAYPLMDLANLLIHDSEGYLVRIESRKEAEQFKMYQCKQCKAAATSEEVIKRHLMAHHMADFYKREDIETDPPSGQFAGVARCTKTGELLAPPNHHSYAEKLMDLHQNRFPHLSFDEFKRSIEIVRDEALVEQWKEQARKRTVYRLKSDPEAEPVDLRTAEVVFSKQIPLLYETVHRAVVPAKIAQNLEDRDIIHAIRREWLKESRFPLTMSFSMRAAFRHMHLHLFKAGKINFVTHIKPHPIKPDDTIDQIAEVLVFLKENPGSTRQHLLECLYPSLDPQSKKAFEALQPLGWLIERGHIIEFFNGTLSVPLGRNRR